MHISQINNRDKKIDEIINGDSSTMNIAPIKTTNMYVFKANENKKSNMQEKLNDISDCCIAVGLLGSGDFFYNSKSKSKMESFSRIMLILGAAIVTLRVGHRLLFNDNRN